jgi:hypothetical protein
MLLSAACLHSCRFLSARCYCCTPCCVSQLGLWPRLHSIFRQRPSSPAVLAWQRENRRTSARYRFPKAVSWLKHQEPRNLGPRFPRAVKQPVVSTIKRRTGKRRLPAPVAAVVANSVRCSSVSVSTATPTSRMLKTPISVVLASLRGSTYGTKYDSPLRSLRPRYTDVLTILRNAVVQSRIDGASILLAHPQCFLETP